MQKIALTAEISTQVAASYFLS